MNLGASSFLLMEKQIHGEFWLAIMKPKKIEVINKKCDNYGRILLLEINIDDSLFMLVNIYNANKN